MDPNAAQLIALGLICLVAVTVALLGGRMLSRDQRNASTLPGLRASLDSLRTQMAAQFETLQEQRQADIESLTVRIEAAHSAADDAKDIAIVARKRVTKKRGPQAAKERERAENEFVAGVDAHGNVPDVIGVEVED